MADKTKKVNHTGIMVTAAILAGTIMLAFIGLGLRERDRVYRERHVEAGAVVHAQDFLKNPEDRGYFTTESEIIDSAKPGEYHLKLWTGLSTQDCRVIVTDTVPPAAAPKTVCVAYGGTCEAKELVTDIEDETDVQVSFAREPDFTKFGRQEVKVRLADAGGNSTEIASELIVSQVVQELDMEAGGEMPSAEDFLLDGEKAEFVTWIDTLDGTKPGTQAVTLKVDGIEYESRLNIMDTTPPEVSVHDIEGFTLLPRKPEDFIETVNDVTQVKAYFTAPPDLTLPGSQSVEIRIVDEGGNEAIRTAELILTEDTEAPVITGAKDLSIMEGQAAAYRKYVTVTDNCPEGLDFTVDSSAVNLNQAGVYPVVYTATDYAGNSTSVTVNLTVQERKYDIDQVNAAADEILAEILKPEMEPVERVRAIYNYVKTHVYYIEHSEKGDYVRAAYEGLIEKRGDCYVYACTTKVLLTRAGIQNMDIEKIPTRTHHYWNLVNLGEGWYHLDTTPRSDHPDIFMWTEEQLMAYTAQHFYPHNYDHSLYPEVN